MKKEQPVYEWQDKGREKKMDTFRMSQHGQILDSLTPTLESSHLKDESALSNWSWVPRIPRGEQK